MKDRITIKAPSGKGMTAREGSYFMATWWRVVDQDDSIIAYVPDKSTANLLASVLNAKMGRGTK